MSATTGNTSDGPAMSTLTKSKPNDSEEQKTILEQYKLYVESAEQTSERRSKANHFYMTLHTLFYGAMWGMLLREWENFKSESNDGELVVIIPFLFLGFICICWWFNVRSYDQLNAKKFEIVGQLEGKLPVRPWTDEWALLGKGQDYRLYWPLSRLERWVPVVMVVLDIITVILVLVLLHKP